MKKNLLAVLILSMVLVSCSSSSESNNSEKETKYIPTVGISIEGICVDSLIGATRAFKTNDKIAWVDAYLFKEKDGYTILSCSYHINPYNHAIKFMRKEIKSISKNSMATSIHHSYNGCMFDGENLIPGFINKHNQGFEAKSRYADGTIAKQLIDKVLYSYYLYEIGLDFDGNPFLNVEREGKTLITKTSQYTTYLHFN